MTSRPTHATRNSTARELTVVSVHDSVDESIQQNGKVDITVVIDLRVQPIKEENGCVVVHVQEAQLSPLFPQDNEDCIPEVPDFGNIEQPQKIGNGGIDGIKVIAWLQKSVIVTVCQQPSLNRHVSAQHDLRDIVDEFDRIWVHGRNAQLHDKTSNDDKGQVSQGDVEGRGEIGQRPSLKQRGT